MSARDELWAAATAEWKTIRECSVIPAPTFDPETVARVRGAWDAAHSGPAPILHDGPRFVRLAGLDNRDVTMLCAYGPNAKVWP